MSRAEMTRITLPCALVVNVTCNSRPAFRFSQRMKSSLVSAVADVLQNEERRTEKYLFGLALTHAMFFLALPPVALIPVEAFDPVKVHQCILL